MRKISRLIYYDDGLLAGKIPEEVMRISSEKEEDYPIFLKEEFLTYPQCRQIIEQFMSEKAAIKLEAEHKKGAGIRRAEYFPLEGKGESIYQTAFESTQPEIENFFKTKIINSDGAHGLGYRPGCKYDLHADNCDPILEGSDKVIGFNRLNPNRQLSSVLFLTESVAELSDDYQHIGGNLSFRFLKEENGEMLLVEPRPGLLVAFPSSPIFSHEVHEVYAVSTGFRVTIVNWYSCM